MRSACIALCALAIGALLALPATGKDENTVPAFTPATGTLEHTAGTWQVWTVRDQPGDPRRRAIPYRTRYFRQRIGADTAELAYEVGFGSTRGSGSRRKTCSSARCPALCAAEGTSPVAARCST